MKYFNYKFLMVLLALAMAIPAARAQDELTLYDETSTNSYVPFYGLYFDTSGTFCQVIYPESDLEELSGTEISGIKFYTDNNGIKFANSKVEISLGTTDQTTFGDPISSGLTTVATIAITKEEGSAQVIEINFDAPFTYILFSSPKQRFLDLMAPLTSTERIQDPKITLDIATRQALKNRRSCQRPLSSTRVRRQIML